MIFPTSKTRSYRQLSQNNRFIRFNEITRKSTFSLILNLHIGIAISKNCNVTHEMIILGNVNK